MAMNGCVFKIIVLISTMLQSSHAIEDLNQTKAISPIDYFLNINQDASLVTWAHAVNSNEKLNEALNGTVMMLETDISSGFVTGEETTNPIPIMAHPPATTSDISLKKWLQTVIEANKTKGIKLDFKNISVVEESLELLKSYESQISFPVFINADILAGPTNSTATPVDADQFLTLVQKYYPYCILSVGWTTYYDKTESWYTWQYVINMYQILNKHHIKQTISFPIRAIFLDQSYKQLRWLTSSLPGSGITVWSAKNDPVEAFSFTSTLRNYNKNSVYFDLPEPLHSEFMELKQSLVTTPQTQNPLPWVSVNKLCGIPTQEAIVLTGSCDVLYVRKSRNTIKGVVEFLDNLVESLAINLRFQPWLWLVIHSNGTITKPDSTEINNLQSNSSVQCFKFEIEDNVGSNVIKVKITKSKPPGYLADGEGVSFNVAIPDNAEVRNLAFNAVGGGVTVIHSLEVKDV